MHGEGKGRSPEEPSKPMETIEDLADKMRETLYMKDLLEGANFQMQKENEELQRSTQRERREKEALQVELTETQIKAEHDPLTGLLNRAGLETMVKKLHEQNVDSVLMVLDIDKFKSINDKFGHLTGDEALKAAAKFLKEKFRPTDLTIRLGGEEMAVLFPNTTIDDATNLLQRVSGDQKIEVPFEFNSENHPDVITFSGGITEFKAGEPLEAAINRADKALYEAKENGRNQLLIVAEPSE